MEFWTRKRLVSKKRPQEERYDNPKAQKGLIRTREGKNPQKKRREHIINLRQRMADHTNGQGRLPILSYEDGDATKDDKKKGKEKNTKSVLGARRRNKRKLIQKDLGGVEGVKYVGDYACRGGIRKRTEEVLKKKIRCYESNTTKEPMMRAYSWQQFGKEGQSLQGSLRMVHD